MAFWSGVAAIAAGRDLRLEPLPGDPKLETADLLRLWVLRLSPAEYFVGVFVGLSILVRLLALLFGA